MVSIYDIAKAAGVSAATVSRALRNSPRVSEESRRRIQEVAAQLGYRPNLLARNLRQRTSSMLGVVVDDVSDEFAGQIIKGAEDEAKAQGYHLIVWSAHKDAEAERVAVQTFNDLQLDGVIMADTWLHSTAELPALNAPAVFVNRRHAGEQAHYVGPDDEYGAYIATEHLLDLGHRRIAYISGPLEWRASPERLKGFQKALRDRGVLFDPDLVAYGDWRVTSGEEHAMKFLTLPERPTAVFAANDYMALGVMDAARKLGLRIPEDLSVIGYDDRAFARFTRPRLTTVSLPLYDMGVQAARRLLALLQDRTVPPEPVAVRGKLFVRESTCPPKS